MTAADPGRDAILVATFSPGKGRELRRMLAALGRPLVSLAECGIGEAYEEAGATYEENARGKGLHYARLAGRLAIADDSGLEVDALGGAPGILSARYAGPDADDAARVARLLAELATVPDERRTARYVSVVAVARPDGETRLFRGLCEGRVTLEPRGGGGFGYDPLFFYPPLHATFAELKEDEKNQVSHRGRAFRALAAFLSSAEGRSFTRG